MPAVSTWPMITSETWSGFTPARSSTFLITSAPRSAAGVLASVPPNLPIGVRAAPTMTMSSMGFLLVQSLLHVAARRGFDRSILDIAEGAGCRALAALVPGEPFTPHRPPAAGFFARRGKPLFGLARQRSAGPVASPVPGRRID